MSGNARPNRLFRNLSSKIASIPMALTALVIFIGCSAWTVVYSFTGSRLLPKTRWVGVDQYDRLWGTDRWIVSIENLAIYGGCMLMFSLTLGFVMAALLDQRIRFENTFRTVFLYPYALSFVVTGLTWQWMLNPTYGLQKVVRDFGLVDFSFAPLTNSDFAIYGVLLAGLWQGTGLVMVIMLAGLRGVDEDIWKASRVDGIPKWKTYIMIVLPLMRGAIITAVVLVATSIIKVFDLIVAQTQGGPGLATEVPAKYVMDMMFRNQNLGQGFAASTMMLLFVMIILIPWAVYEYREKRRG
ncbi:MAG TPA: sugar ABC transporter permease [Alphaproteobacteria bacterium]|nr:sugar ABC transporter permease [Alphaproteobacteria bacterium]HBP72628.1 sugar ABC transporter permease [Alphaproteobacteria bacterium]